MGWLRPIADGGQHAVAMATLDGETIVANVMGFIPSDKLEVKRAKEKVDYRRMVSEALHRLVAG